MNSYLIVGGTFEQRLEKAKKLITDYGNHPDILPVNPAPSVGISQVRQLQKFLSLKPHQAKVKVVILPEAEKLTLAAQNAFLKTLEEPPAHSIIILSSQSKENLLPTIISRCQIVQLGTQVKEIDKKLFTIHYPLFTKLLNSRVGERLKLIEPYEKTREEAIKFCEEMILVLREILIHPDKLKINKKNPLLSIIHYPLSIESFIASLQQTLNLLNANVNVKLCLDNFVLAL